MMPNDRDRPSAPIRAAITLLAGAIIAGVVIVAVPLGLGPLLTPHGAVVAEAGITIALFGALIVAGLVGRSVQRVRFPLRGNAAARGAAVGAAAGAGGLGLATGFAAIAGTLGVSAGGGAVGALLLLGLGVIAVQVLGEEILVRGWLLPALGRDLGMPAAVALTALLFAALHLLGGTRAPLTLLNLLLGGVLFGLLAWRSGGLLAPIAAHLAYNATEMLLFGLDPNPGMSVYGAVWNLDLVGAAAWGGSEEGLNASLAMTFALVAVILPVAVWRKEPDAAVAAETPPVLPPVANRHAWLLGEER